MKITTLATTVAVLALGATSQAVNLATWTFETSVPATSGPHMAEAGVNAATSFASGNHTDAGVVYSNPAGNGSVESFSSNFWNTVGDYYQFTFSATGYENITFGWDQAASGTGPKDFTVAVSTDGVNFTNVLSNYVVLANASPNPTWNTTTYNAIYTFAPLALTVDNEASVTVRLVNNVAAATGGTNRVDNVTVDGTEVVPEPATMAILGLGIAALARRKRK